MWILVSRSLSIFSTASKNSSSLVEFKMKKSYLFWFGDLNYRINLHDSEVRHELECMKNTPSRIKNLLKFDQLSIEKNGRRAFQDFLEANIDFNPSYKFDLGTCDYDTRYSFIHQIMQLILVKVKKKELLLGAIESCI